MDAVLDLHGDIHFRNCGVIEMTGNYNTGSYSGAGALYAGSVVFEGTESVTLQGNYAETDSVHDISVGAIYAYEGIVFRDCGEVDITENTGQVAGALFADSVVFEGTESVTLRGNEGGAIRVVGGGRDIVFRNCGEVEIAENTGARALSADSDVVFEGTNSVTLRGNEGGAIRTERGIVFRNCGEVEITGNNSKLGEGSDFSSTSDSASPLYSMHGTIVFEANDRVVIRGNYIANGREDDRQYLLRALTVGRNSDPSVIVETTDMVVKVWEGQTFECYDSVRTNGMLYVNGDSEHLGPEEEEVDRYRGTVTFSGRYTVEDLEKIKGRKLTPREMRDMVAASRCVRTYGVRVCDGTLALEDGVILRSDCESTPDSASASGRQYYGIDTRGGRLEMRDATIYTENSRVRPDGSGSVVRSSGSVYIGSAGFSGANTIYARFLESTGGTCTFHVSERNLTEPLVTLKNAIMAEDGTWTDGDSTGLGTFTSREGTVFDIQFEGTLAAGQYKLLKFGAWGWESGIPEITGKANSTVVGEEGEGDVYWMTDGDTVTLIFDTAGGTAEPEPEPEPEPMPEDRQPTTLTWGNGNGTWADSKGNEDGHWSGEVTDKNFYTGDSVVFDSAAEVTLQGILRPGNVLVNNADGTVKFTGSGQITDVDIPSRQVKLTKEGAGTLEIDTNNAYTGGTELKAGTLVTGNAGALGLGAVRVSGGTLDMGGNALTNELDVAGTANVANAGKYAGKLVLESGTLNGDLNLGRDAELKGGTVAGALSGWGGVAVSGDATLAGTNTYTGKTTVQGGGNLHVTGSLASKELEVQSGGTYSGAISGTGLNVNLAGGAIAGDVTLGEGSTLRATAQGAAVKGKLSVASGGSLSVKDVQEGATLSVGELVADGGKLALDPAKPDALGVGTFTTTANRTALDTGDDVLNREAGEYTLFTYKSLGSGSSADSLFLEALEGLHTRKQFDLSLRQTSLVLTVTGESADLTWQGSTGTWTNSNTSGGWDTSVEDKQFYDGDRVTFDAAAQDVEAKVEGTVTPGEVTVQGDKDVTLSGEGNIAGVAPLTKKGKGTLDIQTDNGSYRGDITVTEGTLRAGNANALGTGSVYVNGATFDANNISVAAKVTMRGQSTLEKASNMKALTFDSGARVKSTTGYTLASGNTLTIGPTGSASYTGDFTFAGGTLALTGGVFDLSNATVSFSGEQHSVLDLRGWEGLTYGQEYTLFMGDMATDMLDVYLGNEMDGAAHLETRGDKIVLVIGQSSDIPGGTPGMFPLFSRDQRAAYSVLTRVADSGTATGTLMAMAEQVRMAAAVDPSAARALLDRLSGAELATVISSQMEGNMAHLRRLRGAIGSGQAISSNHRVGAYITGYTEDNRLEQDAQGRGYHRTEIGGTLGVETARRDGKLVVGAALSAGRAYVSPSGPALRYHEDIIREDVYLVANFGRLRSTTTVGLGQHEIDTRRTLPNGVMAHAKEATGSSVNLSEELAVTLNRSEKHSFESFFAVESSYNRIDGFSEGGANPAALNVDAHEAFATDLSLGLRANFLFPMVSGAPSAVFSVQGAAITSVGDTVTDVTMHYAGAPDFPYSVRSAKRNRWGYSAGASLTVPVTPNAAVFGSSEAILRGDSHEVTATLGVKLNF